MSPKQVIVSGYATLDYVVQLTQAFHGTGTVISELGVSGAWPRAGGAALYASRRIAAAGHRALAMTWIGDDGDGGHFLRACQRSQICCDAIDQRHGVTTPRCILIYQPDGDYGCLLDTGFSGSEAVTQKQLELIGAADHLCISVGPAVATKSILDACPLTTPMSWIAKLDRSAYPPDLCRLLAARAKVIFCNASEREFIESAFQGKRPAGQIIIETLGSAGVLIDGEDGKRIVQAQAIEAHDTTGAGDTLAGEVVAHLVAGDLRIDRAVEQGMLAARDLLASRLPPQVRSNRDR